MALFYDQMIYDSKYAFKNALLHVCLDWLLFHSDLRQE